MDFNTFSYSLHQVQSKEPMIPSEPNYYGGSHDILEKNMQSKKYS